MLGETVGAFEAFISRLQGALSATMGASAPAPAPGAAIAA